MIPAWARPLQAIGPDITPAAADASMAVMARWLTHDLPPLGRVERDLPYGAHPLQCMDMFRGDDGGASRGALVFIHGGGFVAGDKRERAPFYDNVGWWAVRQGLIGITLNHRLAPEHPWPSAIEDLERALQAVLEHGAAWGLDPARVCLMGHSAGAAHLAGWLAHDARAVSPRPRVARAILVSGLYDYRSIRLSPGRVAYLGSDVSELAERSPSEVLPLSRVPLVFAVAEHDPPEMIAQAEAQLMRQQDTATAPAELIVLDGHNHFSTVLQLGAEPSALDACVRDLTINPA